MTGLTGAAGSKKKRKKRDDKHKRDERDGVEENPIVAAYKEKMDLLEVHCNEAKDLTLHLNMSIATVQKYMTLATRTFAKKSESEEEESRL